MKRNSKKWKEILAMGCGGHWTDTPNGRDFDCENGYTWGCDQCPCCITMQEEKRKRRNMKTLKEVNKELMNELKKHYRSGRMVCYKGYEDDSHVIIKPFKLSKMEFSINLQKGIRAILRSDKFNEPYDRDRGCDPDMKIYYLNGCGSLEKGFDFKAIIDKLKYAIKIYTNQVQREYDEGFKIEIEYLGEKNREEAKRLAKVCYSDEYLKELGIKEG